MKGTATCSAHVALRLLCLHTALSTHCMSAFVTSMLARGEWGGVGWGQGERLVALQHNLVSHVAGVNPGSNTNILQRDPCTVPSPPACTPLLHVMAASEATHSAGAQLPFESLAGVLQAAQGTASRTAVNALLEDLFGTALSNSAEDATALLYVCCCKLAPDADGMKLGMGPAALTQAVATATGLTVEDVTAMAGSAGDLGTVLMGHTPPRQQDPGSCPSVQDVLHAMRRIAQLRGAGTQKKRQSAVAQLLRDVGGGFPRCFAMRCLCGRLRCGVTSTAAVTALGRAAARGTGNAAAAAGESALQQHKLQPSLDALVQHVVRSGSAPSTPTSAASMPAGAAAGGSGGSIPTGSAVAAGTPCTPIVPMAGLAVRSVEEAVQRLKGAACAVEWKYDGERGQVHGDECGAAAVFSRGCLDITGKYPDVLQAVQSCERAGDAQGVLQEAVQRLFPHVTPGATGPTKYIVDGEVVACDATSGALRPFQVLSKRKRKGVALGDVAVPVTYFAFDLLQLHGVSLLQEPLSTRRALLHAYFKDNGSTFRYATGTDLPHQRDAAEDRAALLTGMVHTAVQGSCEGVMLKPLHAPSPYIPGKRKWFKLKRAYMQGVGDSLDLVVVGATMGRGKRGGGYGSFLMACLHTASGRLQTVCNVGSGLSQDALQRLTHELRAAALPSCPDRVLARHHADVWFAPALVWEVSCADLSASSNHTACM